MKHFQRYPSPNLSNILGEVSKYIFEPLLDHFFTEFPERKEIAFRLNVDYQVILIRAVRPTTSSECSLRVGELALYSAYNSKTTVFLAISTD